MIARALTPIHSWLQHFAICCGGDQRRLTILSLGGHRSAVIARRSSLGGLSLAGYRPAAYRPAAYRPAIIARRLIFRQLVIRQLSVRQLVARVIKDHYGAAQSCHFLLVRHCRTRMWRCRQWNSSSNSGAAARCPARAIATLQPPIDLSSTSPSTSPTSLRSNHVLIDVPYESPPRVSEAITTSHRRPLREPTTSLGSKHNLPSSPPQRPVASLRPYGLPHRLPPTRTRREPDKQLQYSDSPLSVSTSHFPRRLLPAKARREPETAQPPSPTSRREDCTRDGPDALCIRSPDSASPGNWWALSHICRLRLQKLLPVRRCTG